ncbi:hypothetical protein DAI22_06g099600 [Oryza sativa Japonica Group]|nr:hypothetical protein DAI22_06g099600 [Oryza sativa Japonica Group]
MKFKSTKEAWEFWTYYGGRTGFDVRINYENKSKVDGVITSARYVCSNEGYRAIDKRDHNTKRPRAETRTGCKARIRITVDREVGDYSVYDLVLEHNHELQLPSTCHLMPSQRKISSLQAFEIETMDDSGIGPKAAHELASRQVGGSVNLGYTRRVLKNHLRTKRQRELMYGEAGKNTSFHYALQLDCEEQITNIFWADAKMIIDYAQFGDVVTFDTTFGTNKEYMPFGVFVGFNHFRETVIFGAALLYDETFDSFKWFACMYEYEDEATFEETFSTIRSKVHKQTWLNSIYKVKEKWAECYMRNVYTLGMRSTQLSESLNNDLKNHLKSDLDIIQFFNNLERVIKGKRDNELDAEYEARKKLPRIKMRVPILVQASKIYTPCIFEYFQNEYERSMAAYIKSSEHNEFIVAIEAPGEASTFEEECKVVGNYAEQQALCTCGQFERTGILCSHALKVLDVMNIKSLPKRYILKRWTREARVGAIEDCYGKIVV